MKFNNDYNIGLRLAKIKVDVDTKNEKKDDSTDETGVGEREPAEETARYTSTSASTSNTEMKDLSCAVDDEAWASDELSSNLSNNLELAESPSDFFKLFFKTKFMSCLMKSINTHPRRGHFEIEHDLEPWKDTSIKELYKFLALLLHMENIRLNSINVLWSNDPLFKLNFTSVMKLDRFLSILNVFSFTDPNDSFYTEADRFLRPIFKFFNNSMKAIGTGKKFSKDNIIIWSGCLKNRHFQDDKYKRCVKLYLLKDANGIVQKIDMSRGLNGQNFEQDKNRIVMMLMKDYIGYFNFDNVISEDVSEIKSNIAEKHMVDNSYSHCVSKTKLSKGTLFSCYSDRNACLNSFRYDRNVFLILTDHHSDSNKSTRSSLVSKPRFIVKYNRFKKSVGQDKFTISRFKKPTTLYRNILFHVMELMLLNAYKLYKHKVQEDSDDSPSMFYFRLDIFRYLLHMDRPTLETDEINTINGKKIHLPEESSIDSNGKASKMLCCNCLGNSNIGNPTEFICPLCPGKPALCLPCFRHYHNY